MTQTDCETTSTGWALWAPAVHGRSRFTRQLARNYDLRRPPGWKLWQSASERVPSGKAIDPKTYRDPERDGDNADEREDSKNAHGRRL